MKKQTTMTLRIDNLRVSVDGKKILQGIDLMIKKGEVHAIMGPNGSGKSTLASALLGHPQYTVHNTGKIILGKKNILSFPTEKRAKQGLFLAFQSPVAITGVSVMHILREAYHAIHGQGGKPRASKYNPAILRQKQLGDVSVLEFTTMVKRFSKELSIDEGILQRGIHDGFSGGEKKKIEMLQALMLRPKFAVFDEIDTGLDVDALKSVAYGIEELRKNGTGILIITHYQRILRFVQPDHVHVLMDGKIVQTGTARLAKDIEKNGYAQFR